jgi:hypothetical protein
MIAKGDRGMSTITDVVLSASRRLGGLVPAAAALLVLTVIPAHAVRAGRFDFGKMWTFEYAPNEYFSETYGFDANDAWFERARLSVLRIPGCSASFVSPDGLVATNHHCVRGAIVRVTEEGESLLDDGFVAKDLNQERPIPNYYADQLIAIYDVSHEVFAATDQVATDEEREEVRGQTLEAIEARLLGEHAGVGDSVWVQMIGLYHGGRYSAYVFKRYTDVRLVVAAELQMGFFGGDADNFTYPRYDLDFAFLRIYDADGNPHRPQHYLKWPEQGVEPGDPIFIIGNPGSTNRLRTVSQLEYQRDVAVPVLKHFLETRLEGLRMFYEAETELAESMNLRNLMFGLSNSLKASTGRLTALEDPMIMARKADAERQLVAEIRGDAELRARYGALFDRFAEIQRGKREMAAYSGAFFAIGNRRFGSATLRRAMAAHDYLEAQAEGAPAARLDSLRGRILAIGDPHALMEAGTLTLRFEDFERFLGPDHEITRTALGGHSPARAATVLREQSVLEDSARTAEAVASGSLTMGDPAVRLAAAFMPVLGEFRGTSGPLNREEDRLESGLGRVRFEVYGRTIPPDGTFSPRIADGVVQGYEYNGTLAPPYTTFYGLYDRYRSHGPGSEWDLPERWQTPPEGLDLATPLNFCSTTDSYGGNSGSPAVTPELELVGLNFDRNIEGLSRDFIYLPERGRNVMVDVRAIRAALDVVYDADRIVRELETGVLFRTEAEADGARR